MQTFSRIGLTNRRFSFGSGQRRAAVLAILGLAIAASSRTHAQSPAPPLARSSVMEADTPLTTVNGTGLVAPRRWSVRTAPAAVVLGAPEGGSFVAFSRYIAEAPLLARQVPQVAEGSDEYYGMGLKIDRIWGVPVLHHGGSMSGYRSDMIWLPDHGVGAVILTNSDSGGLLRGIFRRRLLEVLFDGEPRAAADLAGFSRAFKASRGEGRKTLTEPADPAAAQALAARYTNADLGNLVVRHEGGKTVFDFGGWSSEVASRKNEDGSITFVTITPGADGYEFDAAAGPEGRRLIIREAPRVYAFSEAR